MGFWDKVLGAVGTLSVYVGQQLQGGGNDSQAPSDVPPSPVNKFPISYVIGGGLILLFIYFFRKK